MSLNMKIIMCFFSIYFIAISVNAQQKISPQETPNLKFIENKGQWCPNVMYRADLNNGCVFLEKKCFTYVFYSKEDYHQDKENHPCTDDFLIRQHAYKVNFLNSRNDVKISGSGIRPEYYNYFIGKDKSKWESDVRAFEKITYSGLYKNIDVDVYSKSTNLKYDIIIKPGANIGMIKMLYEGVENIYLEGGNLHITTSVNEVIEQKPFSYQVINGKKIEIPCRFIMENNKIAFQVSENYNRNYDLIIDPVIVASSYCGSIVETYGSCATYDNQENIYGAGQVFSIGYPVTLGAIQPVFAGGLTDMIITKFDADCSNLIFATYLGGSEKEYPKSMCVNNNNDLYILGTSGSNDYPTTSNAYDSTFNSTSGGPWGMSHDIVVVKINSTGTILLGSTYIGGSLDDGNFPMYNNYLEDRGEIIVDNNGNCYVASFTYSSNFPTTLGAFQTTLHGTSDGVVFKLNSDLSTLIWSTFLGGNGTDGVCGLKLDNNNDLYIAGWTMVDYGVNNFPTTSGTVNPTPLSSGVSDGFVAKLSSNGSNLIYSTYFGSSDHDFVDMIDIDQNNNVYIVGNTIGNMPVTPVGIYSNFGGTQFITKLTPNLDSIVFSTVFGSGHWPGDITPTAFMVDNCGYIYLASHCGMSVWAASTGMPTTSNAFQTSNGFYFFILEPNAANLYFASYLGDYGDHGHFGHGRFDPSTGILYHIFCNEAHSFPTTSNAYSQNSTVGSMTYEMGVFKIDFEIPTLYVNLNDTTICFGDSAVLDAGNPGSTYQWSPGGQTTQTITVSNTGTYYVTVSNGGGCSVSGSMALSVNNCNGIQATDTLICQGDTAEIYVNVNFGFAPYTYSWSGGLPPTAGPHAVSPSVTTNYYVTVSDSLGTFMTDTATVIVVNPPFVFLGNDTTACNPYSFTLNGGNPGSTYFWSPGGQTTQTISISTSGTYCVTVTNGTGCSASDCRILNIINCNISSTDTTICSGDTAWISVTASFGTPPYSYEWSGGLSATAGPHGVSPIITTDYYVTVTDSTGITMIDTATVTVIASPVVNLGNDTIFCTGTSSYTLNAGNPGSTYLWQDNSSGPTFIVTLSGTYWVRVSNACGSVTDTVEVNFGNCDCNLYIPNVFSPNGDGKNDIFFVRGACIKEITFFVYDRWGEKIFETHDATKGWDGTFRGKEMDQGVFVYYVMARLDDESVHKKKGTVTLVR
jgi:gliding motility-associated-like protein